MMKKQKKTENSHTVKITLPENLLNLFNKKLGRNLSGLSDTHTEAICQQSLQCAVSYLLKDTDKNMKEILAFSKIGKECEDEYDLEYNCDKRVLRQLDNICFRKDLRTFEKGIKLQEHLLILFIRFGLNTELVNYKNQSNSFYEYMDSKCKLESGSIEKLLCLDVENVKFVLREKHKSGEDTNGRSIGRKIAKLINTKRKLNNLKTLSEEQKRKVIKEARKLYMNEKKNSKRNEIPSNEDLAKQFYKIGTFSEYEKI